MTDTSDMHVCTNIGNGVYDHMLQPMREAIDARMTALAPWAGLREVAEVGESITEAMLKSDINTRHRVLVECQRKAMVLEHHPAGLVQEAARQLKVHILAGLGLP